MSHLSNALHRYYSQEFGHLIFVGEKGVQELSLSMWQELNYSKIDPSVLSRVMQGKRLFTPEQLFVFCKILHLSQTEIEYLFYCLSLDHWQRDKVAIDHIFLPTKEIARLIDSYIQDTHIHNKKEFIVTKLLEFIARVEQYKSKP